MVSGKYPTLPSLRLGLESRLGLGLSLGLREGRVGGFLETWIDLNSENVPPMMLGISLGLCEGRVVVISETCPD